MASLGIRFDGKLYWCGDRSYPRLVDAASYARVLLGLPPTSGPGIAGA